MELKAEMGTLDFNKRLRNIAVDKSRMVFKEEYVKGGYLGRTPDIESTALRPPAGARHVRPGEDFYAVPRSALTE